MIKLLNKPGVMIVMMVLLASGLNAQERKGAQLVFEKESAELGTLYTDKLEPISLEIDFTNSGIEPLVISYVRGCCGTRITDWTKEPVLPGAKGKITVEFRLAPRAHRVSRTVSVMSNDPDGMKIFRIRGDVAEPEVTPFGTTTGAGPRTN